MVWVVSDAFTLKQSFLLFLLFIIIPVPFPKIKQKKTKNYLEYEPFYNSLVNLFLFTISFHFPALADDTVRMNEGGVATKTFNFQQMKMKFENTKIGNWLQEM